MPSQKIASCINFQLPIVFFKKSTFSDMRHCKTYMYINFQQYRISRSLKTVHTNIFCKKLANCINLQLAVRILNNHASRTCTTPSRTFRPILRLIGLLEIPLKEIISTDDRRTDRRQK